jgi:hypothetical protein
MKIRAVVLGLVGAAVIVGGGLVGYQAYVEQQAEQRIEAAVRELPPNVKVDYGEVEVGPLGQDLSVKDVQLVIGDGNPIRIAEVRLLDVDTGNEPPNYLHAKALGIRQDLAAMDDQQAAMLRKLGYEQIQGNYELQYRYNPQTKALDLQELRGELQNMGSLTLRMQLDNFELENPAVAVGTEFPEFELRQMTLSYQDDSLVRRVIAQGAQEQGVTEEQFVEKIVQDIDAQTADLQDPFFTKVRDATKEFIRNPGTLIITADPAQAVPVMEIVASAMIRPADLPQELNMDISTSK